MTLFEDIMTLMGMFYYWVFIFGLLHEMMRRDYINFGEDNEYINLGKGFSYILISLRTSMGDLQLPRYTLWTEFLENTKNSQNKDSIPHLYLIINIIWATWMAQIVATFIINLNLVIAVLG